MKSFAARVFVFPLFVICYLVFGISTVYAANPPDPKPCQNPIYRRDQLVNNYVLDEEGVPPILLDYPEIEGKVDDEFDLPAKDFQFTIDFSKLQAIFGGANSDYLEGATQEENHRQTNVIDMNSQNFMGYFGPNQKISPQVVIDEQKVKYVNYVYEHNQLAESANEYSDINGENPKAVYELVNEYGQPDPNAEGWKAYWGKIPTAYSEFYKGELLFHIVAGEKPLFEAQHSEDICPITVAPAIEFVIPDFYRTTAVSDQLNRQIVANSAQSFKEHGILTELAANSQEFIKEAWAFCRDLLANPTGTAKEIRKTISTIFVKEAFAAEESAICLTPTKKAREGSAPYCPLPASEVARLGASVSCINKSDDLKLEKDNPNVMCTFRLKSRPVTYKIGSFQRNECRPKEGTEGILICKPHVYIIPNFRIPWLAAIWNNTLYSDESEHQDNNQETGRPGIYTNFTPESVSDTMFRPSFSTLNKRCQDGNKKACDTINEIWQEIIEKCPEAQPGSAIIPEPSEDFWERQKCMGEVIDKSLPGTVENSQAGDPKERFIGATDCSKNFVRDIALKPKAVQDILGIKAECDLQAAANTSEPGGPPIIGDSCGGKYTTSNAPQGNFGDPNCTYSDSNLYSYLQTVAPAGPQSQVGSADWWFYTIAPCESTYQPNAHRPHHVDGQEDTPDPNGAWGLYQIGSTGRANARYDFGNVEWKLQTRNAIGLLRENGAGYWACS